MLCPLLFLGPLFKDPNWNKHKLVYLDSSFGVCTHPCLLNCYCHVESFTSSHNTFWNEWYFELKIVLPSDLPSPVIWVVIPCTLTYEQIPFLAHSNLTTHFLFCALCQQCSSGRVLISLRGVSVCQGWKPRCRLGLFCFFFSWFIRSWWVNLRHVVISPPLLPFPKVFSNSDPHWLLTSQQPLLPHSILYNAVTLTFSHPQIWSCCF